MNLRNVECFFFSEIFLMTIFFSGNYQTSCKAQVTQLKVRILRYFQSKFTRTTQNLFKQARTRWLEYLKSRKNMLDLQEKKIQIRILHKPRLLIYDAENTYNLRNRSYSFFTSETLSLLAFVYSLQDGFLWRFSVRRLAWKASI